MRKVNKAMLKYITLFIILSFVVAATGCIRGMTLKKNKTTLNTSKKSIALMTIRTSNQVKQQYQLPLRYIYVKTYEGKKLNFEVTRSFNHVKDQFHEYLVSLALPPCKNTIWLIKGRNQAWPDSGFQIATDISFNLEPDSIVYVGHLEMVNRTRNEGEKQLARFATFSGGLLGIGMAYNAFQMAGLSEGTMELTISDRFDEDIKNFKQHYPVLENYTVKKYIMKPKEEEDKGTIP